ncbi:MAG: outer membrane beta-barrel domain-containing protein [Myxococcota bacterium]
MIRTWAVTLALVVPVMALAQTEFEGLDLTKPADPAPPPPPPAVEERKPAAPKVEEPAVERDITQDDRVKSVQRKLYLKRGRFELAPYVGTSVNDPYYTKFGVAVRGAYYLADTLALSARFSLMQVVPTDDVRTAKRNFQSRIFFSVPIWSVMADVEWSALYGKVAVFNSILHFDGYVLGGAGVVNTETSADRGLNVGADLGLGMRFVAKDYMAVNVALINTTYVDQPAGTTKGATQNVMMLNAGVSLFFPFKSTWREAE